MKLEWNGKKYTVEQVTGDVYRVYQPGEYTGVVFTVEHRNSGSYFKYRSSWKNGRTYSAWRYSYKWIPVMREATYLIARTEGLYDYQENDFYMLRKNGVWVSMAGGVVL